MFYYWDQIRIYFIWCQQFFQFSISSCFWFVSCQYQKRQTRWYFLWGGGQKYYREERSFLSKIYRYFSMLWSSIIGGRWASPQPPIAHHWVGPEKIHWTWVSPFLNIPICYTHLLIPNYLSADTHNMWNTEQRDKLI